MCLQRPACSHQAFVNAEKEVEQHHDRAQLWRSDHCQDHAACKLMITCLRLTSGVGETATFHINPYFPDTEECAGRMCWGLQEPGRPDPALLVMLPADDKCMSEENSHNSQLI